MRGFQTSGKCEDFSIDGKSEGFMTGGFTDNSALWKEQISQIFHNSIPLKKTAFCLKTSHFINKYDSPRSQLCQWPRLVHNCNQSFNMPRPSVCFDSHQNIPAFHLGIPGGIENLELQY